jgi:type I restriction enzyme R subunit
VSSLHKTLLDAIICRLNYLFEGQLTDSDKLVYVNNVLKGQLLASELLQQQAASSSKEQFADSAELQSELTNSIINALDAHPAMASKALMTNISLSPRATISSINRFWVMYDPMPIRLRIFSSNRWIRSR